MILEKDKANETAKLIKQYKQRIIELRERADNTEKKLNGILEKEESELTEDDKEYYDYSGI